MSERNVGDSSKAARSEVVEKTGDGSESAGLRDDERIKGSCWRCGKPVLVKAGEVWHSKDDVVWHEVCSYQEQIETLTTQLKACRAELSAAALAPAISRPPTQGSLDTPQSGQHQGYRTIQDVLRLHVTSSESMYETYKRVGTPLEREHQLGITDGLLRAIEVADNWAARNGALAEGQQSGKLVEKTSRDTEGE